MFFLSLPFASLGNLQVVIRLKHGDLDDLSLNLVPLTEEFHNKSTTSGGYSLTPTPEQSSAALTNAPYSMNFQTTHDEQGPLLRIFASQTGAVRHGSQDEFSATQSSPEITTSSFDQSAQGPEFSANHVSSQLHSSPIASASCFDQNPQNDFSSNHAFSKPRSPGSTTSGFDHRDEFPSTHTSPKPRSSLRSTAPNLDHNFAMNTISAHADVPLDADLLRWQFGLAPDASAPDAAVMASSSANSFDLFNFDSCAFNDSDAFLSLCDGGRGDPSAEEETFAFPTPPLSESTASVSASSPTASSPTSPRTTSSFCHLVPEMMTEALLEASDFSDRGRARTAGGTSFKRRRFSCKVPGCNRRFTSQYTLRVHTEAHRPKARPCFPCTLGCKEQFSRQHDRLRHEVAKHGRVCEWICDECRRFFSSSRTLAIHKCKGSAKSVD